MFLTFLLDVKRMLPLEVALTFGVVLFALSWLRPRRLVSLPRTEYRARVLLVVGTAGAALIVLTASLMSAAAAFTYDASGYDGWWRRPAPLAVAVLIVLGAGVALARVPLPAPGDRALVPRQRWRAFLSPALLWVTGATTVLIAVTALWHTVIAVSAPRDASFFGQVPEYTSLPIFMNFNSGLGYVAGAGWPNHLATLIALPVAFVVLFAVLRADANRPLARSAAGTGGARADREATARILGLVLLAGLLATLGAVWMHVGAVGGSAVGLDDQWVTEDMSIPRLMIYGGYNEIARPLNLTGYVVQGAGVALALRLIVDMVRAAFAAGRTQAATPSTVETVR
ncbi:hypothetical protein GCM10022219_06860 [Microbacterium oryzae]|uniref:Uncharacterized protein n=1 Tax=Microbacterium oryzae TaxID=743009 RepID=A0A6I6DVE7_9MICO|nr:hypothetical protein [Microbacterium oryzae]QGU26783.1 hypothetical protein D7D94_03210 [Microbacterium oryzae]